jgi:molybdopterin converting factor small subunit
MNPISVSLPTLFAGELGVRTIDVDAPTVGDALRCITELHPNLKSRIWLRDGEAHHYINFYVNAMDTRFSGGLETRLEAGDQIIVVAAVAGG